MAGRRRVLVTGGAGFVGSHLVDRLVADGDDVIVLDDLSTGSERNLSAARARAGAGVELVVGSVLDERLVASLTARADEVFHLAAVVGVKLVLRDPAFATRSIAEGARVVLRHAAELARPVLVASSSEVYFPSESPLRETDAIREGAPTHARWAYALAKLEAERLALAPRGETPHAPVVVARLFNAVGPRQIGQHGMVVPRFVAQALSGAPLTICGDGRQTRAFCDVRVIADGLVRLLRCPVASGRVVNLGAPSAISITRLAMHVASAIGVEVRTRYVPYAEAYGAGFEDVRTRAPDISLARSLVGFAPTWSLEETIREIAAELGARDSGLPRPDAWASRVSFA